MGEALKKWPHYALDALERTLFELQAIESKARHVQVAIAERDTEQALILLSDVRVMSQQCVENLVRARTGEYKREAKWTANETVMQPVATVMAR